MKKAIKGQRQRENHFFPRVRHAEPMSRVADSMRDVLETLWDRMTNDERIDMVGLMMKGECSIESSNEVSGT